MGIQKSDGEKTNAEPTFNLVFHEGGIGLSTKTLEGLLTPFSQFMAQALVAAQVSSLNDF